MKRPSEKEYVTKKSINVLKLYTEYSQNLFMRMNLIIETYAPSHSETKETTFLVSINKPIQVDCFLTNSPFPDRLL